MSYSERLRFDSEKDEFYIERTFPNEPKRIERLGLETWNFVKSCTVSAIIRREIVNLDIDRGETRVIFYEIPLKYEVSGRDSKCWVLKIEKVLNPDDPFNRMLCKVFLKNLDTSECSEAPLPNDFYEPASRPYLEITRQKSRRLKKGELDSLLKSGTCLGVFDLSLTNKFT